MKYVYSRNIITHSFHVDKKEGDSGIVYAMIILHDLMVHIDLKANFGRQVLEWDETIVTMKGPGNFLGRTRITQCNMQYAVIQTAQSYSTRKY